MTKITELASAQVSATGHISIELIEANETPAVVVVTWPDKATVLHPHRFPDIAATLARLFARPLPSSPASGPGGGCDGARCRVRAIQAENPHSSHADPAPADSVPLPKPHGGAG